MNRLLALLSLLLPALALADVDVRFAKLRDAAEPLGGLSGFLNRYIGECSDVFAGPTCKSSAEAFRKEFRGQKLYMIVTEDEATMVNPGPYDPKTGNYVIQITPFFPGGKYALTHGAPKKTDAQGNPVLPLLSVSGTVPPGWHAVRFNTLFRDTTRSVRAQVIFTPKGVWSLPRKNGGRIYGVEAQVEAVLITEGRTGDTLGLWLKGKNVPTRKR